MLCDDQSAHAIVFPALLTIGWKEHRSGARIDEGEATKCSKIGLLHVHSRNAGLRKFSPLPGQGVIAEAPIAELDRLFHRHGSHTRDPADHQAPCRVLKVVAFVYNLALFIASVRAKLL